MAESYSNLFGTNGSGRQNRIGSLFGQQPSQPQPSQTPTQQAPQQPQQAQRTFAQMQQMGQARPAPQAPQTQAYQPFQGSQQAMQARTQMLQNLQQQLAQPTRFDTQAFQQMRAAQQANLQSEFAEQQRQLNEDLARRGLSASTIGAAGLGRLQGAQSRALADLDAQLLQQAAQTQAQDRLAALQAGGQFAELAGAQDLAEFEARRVGQAQQFQEGLAAAQFGQGQSEFDRRMALEAAQAEQQGGMSQMDLALRQQLGLGGLGIQQQEVGLRAQQLQQDAALQGRSLSLQEARAAAEQDLANRQLAQTSQLQGRELDLRAQQLQQEAGVQGRQLSLQEARLEAEREQFATQQATQQRQFEATLGADERRFLATLQEQQAARLQNLGVSNRELDLRAVQLQQEAQLQGRSLDLQSARDAAEVDFRARQLQQQAELQGRSLDIEQARNEATIGLQRDQLTVEEALRREGIAVDREALAARQQQFDADLALRGELGRGQLQESALERQLREQLGMGGLDIDRQRLTQQEQQFAQELALRGELGRGQLTQEQQRFQLQLAAALAALKPEQIAAFRAQMGTGFPLTPTPTTTGGGTPFPTGGTGTGTGNEIIPNPTGTESVSAVDTSIADLLRSMYGF